jgi:hypothetical protein
MVFSNTRIKNSEERPAALRNAQKPHAARTAFAQALYFRYSRAQKKLNFLFVKNRWTTSKRKTRLRYVAMIGYSLWSGRTEPKSPNDRDGYLFHGPGNIRPFSYRGTEVCAPSLGVFQTTPSLGQTEGGCIRYIHEKGGIFHQSRRGKNMSCATKALTRATSAQ